MSPRGSNRTRFLRFCLLVAAVAALGWGLCHREPIGAVAAVGSPTDTPAGPIAVYFSRPQEFDGDTSGGPEEALIRSIDRARCCVEIAVYDFDLLSVARALAAAARRGVAVRVVTDSDNLANEALDMLRAEGISVVGDGRSALMHEKIIVIDREEIWAGSMNLTVNDAYRNDNNFVRISSPRLNEIFLAEFEEMFTRRAFGPASPTDAPAAAVETDAGPVEALFAPEDHVADRVIRLLRGAKRSIDFLAFSFTSADIAAAMIERAGDGVVLAGVMETTQVHSNTGSQFEPLRQAGAAVFLDANPRNMHHKVILIDGEIVITGSYNFSESAEEKNDEDLLILWNADLVRIYEREFRRIYDLAAEKSSTAGAAFSPEKTALLYHESACRTGNFINTKSVVYNSDYGNASGVFIRI